MEKDLGMYDGVFDNGVPGEGEACWYSRVEENSLDTLCSTLSLSLDSQNIIKKRSNPMVNLYSTYAVTYMTRHRSAEVYPNKCKD
jgi:hypothetical protein